MKKLILIALVICTSICYAANTADDRTVSFGVRVGENNSTGRIPGFSFNAGFHIGGIVDIKLPKSFRIEAGVLFTTKGYLYYHSSRQTAYDPDITYEIMRHVYYLEIPVMAKYVAKINDDFNIHFGIGGAIGFNFFTTDSYFDDGKLILKRSGTSSYWELEPVVGIDISNLPYYEYSKLLYLGLKSQLGFEYKHFYFGLSYDFGNGESLFADNKYTIYNHTLSLTLGYNF